MLLIYNIIQLLALLLLGPFVALMVWFTPKYRGRFGRRLGIGLKDVVVPPNRKRLWIHALSVGETASAKPLVKALKSRYPELFIIFSSTTRGGEGLAQSMGADVDAFVSFPLDIWFVVARFVKHLRPDLFVLIETDFWPNFLNELQKNKIPAVLANGRITDDSWRRYCRFKFFFAPMFDSFSLVSMQTKDDAERMVELGVRKGQVKSLGNLKFDTLTDQNGNARQGDDPSEFHLPTGCKVVVAGSTHPGEEEIVIALFKKLREKYVNLFLVVAPRDTGRGEEVLGIVQGFGLCGWRRTGRPAQGANVMVLDTLGELTKIYAFADVAFVGGSMVDCGGHNPLEAAVHRKPVLFGRYMTDFAEIARDLQRVNAAESVVDQDHFYELLDKLLSNPELCEKMGERGFAFVSEHKGAVHRYVESVGKMLGLQ